MTYQTMTPKSLVDAAFDGSVADVDEALARGEHVDSVDENGEAAIFVALRFQKDGSVIRRLIEAGADLVNHRCTDGDTVLNRLVRRGDCPLIEIALAAGHPVNARSKYEYTPLHIAASEDRCDAIRILLEHRADPNAVDQFGQTPFHLASAAEAGRLLADVLDNVDAKTEQGYTPAMHAARLDLDCLRTLISKGASLDNAVPGSLHRFIKDAEPMNPACIAELVRHGADVNAIGYRERTALMTAARMSRADIVQTLIDAGANIEALDQTGASALFYAVDGNNAATLITLVNAGANMEVIDQGNTRFVDYLAKKPGMQAAYDAHVARLAILRGTQGRAVKPSGKPGHI